MMQAWWMFCIGSLVYVMVSLLTPPPEPELVEGLTWSHPFAALREERFKGAQDPRLILAFLAVIVGILYYIFR